MLDGLFWLEECLVDGKNVDYEWSFHWWFDRVIGRLNGCLVASLVR